MSWRAIAVAISVAIGAALVTGALRSEPTAAAPEASSTTTTTTTVLLPVWVEPAEIVVPPAIILPTRLGYADGLLELDFEVQSMVVGEEPPIRPAAWTLLAGDAEYETEIDPVASRVVFDVGLTFDPAAITGVRLDRYFALSPIQADFLPTSGDFTAHEIIPGVTAAVDLIQEQSNGTIVRIQIRGDQAGASSDLSAEGRGPGWASASSNFGGGGLWTLSFEGSELPNPLPIVIRGVMWLPLEADLVSTLERVPVG